MCKRIIKDVILFNALKSLIYASHEKKNCLHRSNGSLHISKYSWLLQESAPQCRIFRASMFNEVNKFKCDHADDKSVHLS